MNAALLDLALSEVRVQEQVREDEARRTQQYIDVVGELESQLLDLQCRLTAHSKHLAIISV